jgi:hypothetical protein
MAETSGGVTRLTKKRLAVIGELQKAGGVVRSKEGRAVALLHHELGADTSLKALTNALSSMEEHGLIEREIRGKRTFTIKLTKPVEHQEVPPAYPETPEGVPEGLASETVGGVSASPTGAIDYRQLADALLTRVAEVIDTNTSTADIQHRLADTLALAERYRRQLADVGDELRIVKADRDGLRHRLHQAESNIQAMLDARNKVGMGDRQRRALERFMQARPSVRG